MHSFRSAAATLLSLAVFAVGASLVWSDAYAGRTSRNVTRNQRVNLRT